MEKIIIPKGFLGSINEFMEEFKLLCDKYGYEQWLVGVSQVEDRNFDKWDGGSNAVSEGMVEYLQEMAEQMQETLDEHFPS